jgi:glycosyltransferase involved in cell wall biosynthesis
LNKITIQAINVSGLGSVNWVKSFIFTYKNYFQKNFTEFYLNEKITLNNNKKLLHINKVENNFFFKIYFYFKIIFTINKNSFLISLSDLPVPFIKNQILFVNQANLIDPKINKYASSSFIFMIKRLYLRIFIKRLKKIFVQSYHMKASLMKSYKIKPKLLHVLKIPIKKTKIKFIKKKTKITKLLFPANHYLYKNHKIIIRALSEYPIKNLLVYFTATKSEFNQYKKIKSIKRIDYYNHKDTYNVYNKFDGIIYPSKIESLGLPLIEAMHFGIPVLCANLPHAREIFGDKALYFNENSTHSVKQSILKFLRLKNSNKINRIFALNKSYNEKKNYLIV